MNGENVSVRPEWHDLLRVHGHRCLSERDVPVFWEELQLLDRNVTRSECEAAIRWEATRREKHGEFRVGEVRQMLCLVRMFRARSIANGAPGQGSDCDCNDGWVYYASADAIECAKRWGSPAPAEPDTSTHCSRCLRGRDRAERFGWEMDALERVNALARAQAADRSAYWSGVTKAV